MATVVVRPFNQTVDVCCNTTLQTDLYITIYFVTLFKSFDP